MHQIIKHFWIKPSHWMTTLGKRRPGRGSIVAAAASTIQDPYRRSHTFMSTAEDIPFTSMGMATTTMAITITMETKEEMDMGMETDRTMARGTIMAMDNIVMNTREISVR